MSSASTEQRGRRRGRDAGDAEPSAMPRVIMTRVIEQVALEELDLRFAPLRLHSPADHARLKASVQREGIRQPVLASTEVEPGRRVLLDGFKRVRVARELQIARLATTFESAAEAAVHQDPARTPAGGRQAGEREPAPAAGPKGQDPRRTVQAPAAPAQPGTRPRRKSSWIDWATLLRRVHDVDALACPCGGRLEFIALVTEEDTAREMLESMGLEAEPPVVARARDPTWQPEAVADDWWYS